MPWRSVWVPRVLAALALAVGLPLFLRSPPWCDITLYQLAARNLLDGGTHYRDLFDTNLPGFVWAMTALYALFGFNALAVRALDLLVVSGVVLLIDRLAKWSGAPPAARWWMLACAALFYPFAVEMAHAQRDTWMALPGLAAVALRVRRGVGRRAGPEPPPAGRSAASSPFWRSSAEGVLWGAGVWMKPHLALLALAVWVLTARRVAGECPRPWRAAAADLLGNVLGGLTAAVPGVAWLVASGTWRPFLDVFLVWNPMYAKLAVNELYMRWPQELFWFPPWSFGLVPTLPLAAASVLDAAPWSSRSAAAQARSGPVGRRLPRLLWDQSAGADARFVRGVLGGLYLAWALQSFFIQRGFQYVHVVETFLMFGLWAAHRWAWGFLAVAWLAISGGVWLAADHSPDVKARLDDWSERLREDLPKHDLTDFLPRHALANWERTRLWGQCWRVGMPAAERYALWDRLRLHPPHEASIGWEELAEVAAFLRDRGVKDGEVIAWFDSPHAVYLILDVKPGFRFMHVFTAVLISLGEDPTAETGRQWVMDELRRSPRARFVISDLEWTTLGADEAERRSRLGPALDPPRDLLPANAPFWPDFPWNQPPVFRSRDNAGRYIVHELVTRENGPLPPGP